MIDSLARGLCLVGMAICAPARRGLMYVEGRLIRAEYRLRMRTGALFLVFALAVVGCGGVERHARTALDVSAHALVATDVAVAEVYEERAAVHLDAAIAAHPGDVTAARADYAERMRPLFRTRDALVLAREALLVAQSGIDAHGADGILGTIGCVADAFDRVLDALAEIGVDPPPKLRRAIDAIRSVAGDRCEVPS